MQLHNSKFLHIGTIFKTLACIRNSSWRKSHSWNIFLLIRPLEAILKSSFSIPFKWHCWIKEETGSRTVQNIDSKQKIWFVHLKNCLITSADFWNFVYKLKKNQSAQNRILKRDHHRRSHKKAKSILWLEIFFTHYHSLWTSEPSGSHIWTRRQRSSTWR